MSGAVRGRVSLPPDAPRLRAARLLVEVRDVSRSDAPSTVVGSQVQADVPLAPGASVPFEVEVPDLDPTSSYGLRVHVDLSGTGTLDPGDLISTQANPVPMEPTDELIAPVSRL
ncbi:YbaY family lipoprotein [Streptomyces triculaminicus]|uniref:YbaY family lipoprotein n=1 Tax=Streptomyces triculaminicus TaxID=2816232 RepID=UPI0033C3D1A9